MLWVRISQPLSPITEHLTSIFILTFSIFIYFRIIALRKSGRQSDFALALSLVLLLSLRDLVLSALVGIPPSSSIYIAYLFYCLLPFPTRLTAAALVFGVMAGTLCNFATQLKFFAGYDDSLDVSVILIYKKKILLCRFIRCFLTCTNRIDFRLSRYRRHSREFPDCYFCSSTRGFLRWLHQNSWRLVGWPLDSTSLAYRRFCRWS